MGQEELMNKIVELEREIAILPEGSITKKRIVEVGGDNNMNNPWKDINLSDYENHMALGTVHHQMAEQELQNSMNKIGYQLIQMLEYQLPNGKKLVQLDFYKKTVTER